MHSYEVLATAADFFIKKAWLWWWGGFVFTLIVAIRDSPGIVSAIKGTKGRKKFWPISNFAVHWLAVAFTVSAALSSQLGSDRTDTRVDAVDPLNHPIASISAFLKMEVWDTNQNIDISRARWTSSLRFGRAEQASTNIWALIMECKKATKDGYRYFMEFEPNLDSPNSGLWNIGPKDPVKLVDTWDTVHLDALFLKERADVRHGDVTLVINGSIRRQFYIPQQRSYYVWTNNLGTLQSSIKNPDTNRPNVIVVPTSLP